MTHAARSLCRALLALCIAGCGGRSTDVKIPERKIPAAFSGGAPGRSVASVSWPAYFGDAELNDLIRTALKASPDLQVALQRIEIARAGVRQRTGAMLPQVSATAGAGVQKVSRYTPEGAGNASTEITPGQNTPTNIGNFAVGLESTWEIDAWGKLRNQRESAVAQYLATLAGSRVVVTGLVTELASAYYELVALDRVHDVLVQTIARQREALDVVRLQKEAGRANELAVQQFEAQLASTKALDADAVVRVRETENRINLLEGRFPQPVRRNKDALSRNVPTSVSTGIPSSLLENRPDVREAEWLVEAAKCDLRAAHAAFFPSLAVTVGVGLQAFNPKYLLSAPESLFYSASVGLLAPLINRSAIEAEFDVAKASQIQAMYLYQKVVLNAYVEVANGLSRLVGSSQVAELRKARKTALERTVETADILYRAGKASYFEVLLAQQSTLSADLDLIDAMKNQQLASIVIYKALGGGWR